MNVSCDECQKEFWLDRPHILTMTSGDYEVQYFQCPYCRKKYHVLTSDAEMRGLIGERSRIAGSIRLARAKHFKEATIKKMIVKLDKIKQQQEEKEKELKPIGEQLLIEKSGEKPEEQQESEG